MKNFVKFIVSLNLLLQSSNIKQVLNSLLNCGSVHEAANFVAHNLIGWIAFCNWGWPFTISSLSP